MQIRNLEIINLYGHLSKDISFNERITLLVGINGSGKTSALNIINWLLTINFEQLCTTRFDSITLTLTFNGETIVICCHQTSDNLEISVMRNERLLPPINARLVVPTKALVNDGRLRDVCLGEYKTLGPEPHEVGTFAFIRSLPSPVVISLDRSLVTEESSGNYSEDSRRSNTKNRRASESPLVRVRALVSAAHSRYLSEKFKLNRALQQKIMLSAFEVYDHSSVTSSQKIQAAQINQLEKKVSAFLGLEEDSTKGGSGVTSQDQRRMKQYFAHLKEQVKGHRGKFTVLDDTLGRNEVWIATRFALFANQFHKIQGFISAFEQHELASALAFQRLQQYLDTLEKFFSDCAKKVLIREGDGELVFQVVDSLGKVIETVSMDGLSSGERQILILFTYIALNEAATVFIIDEPELSLHPRWQESFLAAVEDLMSDKSQLIFATHSPALVGKHISYCVPLLPYNEINKSF